MTLYGGIDVHSTNSLFARHMGRSLSANGIRTLRADEG